ncbi:MAG: hypothetical protein OSJ73_19815 [Lachnospiraceae bacterium]|jgi:hypothetical protein|nr:hypothetical protein [Lachnospiraceae bacterium]HBV84800.1 hypothetical protein [Lachnospiraceae bacterium]
MIYEYERKEGFYLISELEKLRKKKRHDKLVIKCDEATNPQVANFKKIYLLDGAVNTILYNANNYYIYINNNEVTIYLIYDTCRIAYCLRTETDWKIISVEFLPTARLNTSPHKDDLVGRTLTTTLVTILSFCYTLGFSNVFDMKQAGQIQKISTAIINKEFVNSKFEPEHQIQDKINHLLMKHAIRKDFAEKYLLKRRLN